MDLLLRARAGVATTDPGGNTCLHYAAVNGFHEVMELLVAAVPEDLLDSKNNVSSAVLCLNNSAKNRSIFIVLGIQYPGT